jgi:predicted permease
VQLFTTILLSVMTPILLLAGLGYGVQSRLHLDLGTLSKLQLQVLVPAAILHFLLSARLPLADAWPSFWFTLVIFAVHFALGWLGGAIIGLDRWMRGLVGLAVAFPNSGNIGVALIQLTMPPDYLLHQAVVLSVHMLLVGTIGLRLITAQNGKRPSLLGTIFATPIIPALVLAIIMKAEGIVLPVPLAIPLKMLGEAFTPLALFLLGAQLSAVEDMSGQKAAMALAIGLKLFAAPAVTLAGALLLAFPPGLVAVYVLTAATPTGIILTVLAMEYKAGASFAAATVFLSTVISAITLTCWIYALQIAGYLPPLAG